MKLLAATLGLTNNAVTVVSGHSSLSKVIGVVGLDEESVKPALGWPR